MHGGALAPRPSHGRPFLTHPSPKMHGALPVVPSFAVSPGLTEVEEGKREGERKKTREEKQDSGPSSGFVVGHNDLGGHWQESPPASQNHGRDSDVAKGCAHVMDNAANTASGSAMVKCIRKGSKGWSEGCGLLGPWSPPQPSLLSHQTLSHLFTLPGEVPKLSPGGPWGHPGSVFSRN